MLALEHSRQQQFCGFSSGMECAFHDPYLSQSMNTYGAFDSAADFASAPFSLYDSNSFASEASPDSTNTNMFASRSHNSFKPSSPHSELPPALSHASAASVASNASSTVGSPYSAHAQAVSGHESWSSGNQELGLRPTIINNDYYDQAFRAVDLGSEMSFGVHGKGAEDFVGECTNQSPSQIPSSKFICSEPQQSSQSSSLHIAAKAFVRGNGVTIDSVLEQAHSAITPSLVRSSHESLPFKTSPSTPTKNMQAGSHQARAACQSPSIPASSTAKTSNFSSPSFSSATPALADASLSRSPPINMSFHDNTAKCSTPTYARRIQSPFFAQISGNFIPPIESSCWFFLAVPSLRSRPYL